MKNVKNLIKRLIKDEQGVTMIEYVLIAALIAIVCIAAVTAVGTKASNSFANVAAQLK